MLANADIDNSQALTERQKAVLDAALRLLARLEADGLVEKLPVAEDGRGQTIRITAKGRETRRRMWAVYGQSIAELVGARLSPDELDTVSALLGRMRHPPAAVPAAIVAAHRMMTHLATTKSGVFRK